MTLPLEALFSYLAAAPLPAGRPLVTLSFAQSLDGSIALRRGERLTLSGDASLHFTHRLRSCHDALMVGIGTVLADNPRLTVRLVPGSQPRPVVLDTRLRLPAGAAVLGHPRSPWIVTGSHVDHIKMMALQNRGVEVIALPVNEQGRIDLAALLVELHRRGAKTLMVEGGAALLASFLQARLVDVMAVTVSPHLVGGLHYLAGPTAQAAPLLPKLVAPLWVQVGVDAVVWGVLDGAETAGAAAP